MRRRELIKLLGGAAAWPLAARAQRASKPAPRVGVLLYGTAETDPNYGSFRRGLRELGYVENESIVLEPRSDEDKPERLPLLARELVKNCHARPQLRLKPSAAREEGHQLRTPELFQEACHAHPGLRVAQPQASAPLAQAAAYHLLQPPRAASVKPSSEVPHHRDEKPRFGKGSHFGMGGKEALQ